MCEIKKTSKTRTVNQQCKKEKAERTEMTGVCRGTGHNLLLMRWYEQQSFIERGYADSKCAM